LINSNSPPFSIVAPGDSDRSLSVGGHFNLSLTSPSAGRTTVEDTALSPDGKTLIAIGAIQHAGGVARAQVVMINTGGTNATVDNWYTNFYNVNCYSAFSTYVREVDFSPKGDYFVIVTTGGLTRSGLPCDTASRFETAGTGLHHPTWVNYTGGNTCCRSR
jgi:WD40 repeat protein